MNRQPVLDAILAGTFAAAVLAACTSSPANAQSSTAIPPSLSTPDRVQTSIGTLEFKDGEPSMATAEKVRDTLDFMRALNVYNNSLLTKATLTNLGNIQLLNSRRGMLEIVAQRGFGPEFLDFFGEVHGEGAACGAAMHARQRVIVEDVVTHPIFVGRPAQGVLLRAGVHAVQSTPLITRSGELLGMMSTHFRSRHRVPA